MSQQVIEQLVHRGNRRIDLLEDSAPFGGRHGPVQSTDEQAQGMYGSRQSWLARH